MHVCCLVCTIIIQWQMFTAGIFQNSKFGLTWQQPCYKVTLHREKEGMEQGKNRRDNALREQWNDIGWEKCYRTEKKRDRTSVKMGCWNGFKVVLKAQLRDRDLEEALGSSCLFICVHERETQKKRKSADVCAYWSRSGKMSLYDSAAPVITD